jgi:hypothetical protein
MGFLNRKEQDDEEFAGSGLHLDLEVRRCPQCRSEVAPWQEACPDCGVGTVPARDLPPAAGGLPDLSHLVGDDDGGAQAPGGGAEAADGGATVGDEPPDAGAAER